MVPEFHRLIQPHLTEPTLRLVRQTIFPPSRQHHLHFTPELSRALAASADQYGPAAPQLCDHLSAYLGSQVLLEWHDALDEDPMLLSRFLPEAEVRSFAARIGAHAEEGFL